MRRRSVAVSLARGDVLDDVIVGGEVQDVAGVGGMVWPVGSNGLRARGTFLRHGRRISVSVSAREQLGRDRGVTGLTAA